MTPDETTHYVESAAAILGLEIREEWMANVLRFFAIAETMASEVIASGALTATENAPVFVPRGAE
jgi:Protein of unknown function (DUF4089)